MPCVHSLSSGAFTVFSAVPGYHSHQVSQNDVPLQVVPDHRLDGPDVDDWRNLSFPQPDPGFCFALEPLFLRKTPPGFSGASWHWSLDLWELLDLLHPAIHPQEVWVLARTSRSTARNLWRSLASNFTQKSVPTHATVFFSGASERSRSRIVRLHCSHCPFPSG